MIYLLMSILAVSALDKRRLLDEDEMRVERSGREGLRTRGGGQGPAAFEFANSSGAGMGAACACTSPTGTKGELLTYTRASSAMCSKGDPNAPANGDLVLCSTNQPRVMSGGSGPLGLLVEAARTNYSLRSEELNNAAWLPFSGIVAAPVVTANYATAPDGTATADRVVFPACPTPVTNYSSLYQYNTSPVGVQTSTLYVKGTSGSGNLGFCLYESPGGACSTCAYTAGAWSRCSVTHTSVGGGSVTTPVFGCLNGVLGMPIGNTGAADVLVWGVQVEAGAYATSYIPTTSAVVTRAGSTSSLAFSVVLTNGYSMSATSVLLNGVVGDRSLARLMGSVVNGGLFVDSYYAGGWFPDSNTSSPVTGVTAGTTTLLTNRVSTYHTGASFGACINGVCTSTAATQAAHTATTYTPANYNNSSGFINGIQKQVCLDPNPSRCR